MKAIWRTWTSTRRRSTTRSRRGRRRGRRRRRGGAELPDEERLSQVVSAETQEWEGLEAAEAIGRRADGHPESRLGDHLELREGRLGDDLWLQGRPAARRLPGLAALPDGVVRDRRLGRGRHLGQPDPLPVRHRQRAPESQRDRRSRSVPDQDDELRAADDPDHRLRQAQPGDQRQVRPLGHDDAAAARPGPQRDRPALPAARSQGRHSRRRDRQAQRRLLVRRPEADPPDGQAADRAADQPSRERRLHRLRPRRQRDRLRLRRRRPPLLPPERSLRELLATTPRSTCSPATRRSAGSTRSPSRATATPTTTSSARPASRPSCARPAPRSRPSG